NLLENLDFVVFSQVVENSKGGRPAREHHLSFDAAKHVAMMSSAEKGHAVREYFIAKEKELTSLIANPVDRFPELRAIVQLAQSTAQARLIAEQAQADAEAAKADAEHARAEAAQAHAKADLALDDRRMTIEEFVLKNGLLVQHPPATWKSIATWL